MIFPKTLLLLIFAFQSLCAIPIAEQFERVGYAEICNHEQGTETFDDLYVRFDKLVAFLQKNPSWSQKLYTAKERFIRTKDRNHYSSDFFGFYDDSKREGRRQIAFYYSTHFHEFVCQNYPEFKQIHEFIGFLEACHDIQKPNGKIINEAAFELGLESIFSGQPPILLKVMKYLPSYTATKPHYDGTAFSLFLDSTDNNSLLLSSYKSSFTIEDFFVPPRKFSRERNQNSILLIPGVLLTEFSIYPTPHIVLQSGEIRYATIAFAMRPNFNPQKNEFPILPHFDH